MRELEVFDVCSNHILKLPKCIGNWHKLKQLLVDSNELTEFPVELASLSNLQVLLLCLL
jgi:Leucine-rich repeat (LRR) protein